MAGICRGSRGHNLEDGGTVWPREEPDLSRSGQRLRPPKSAGQAGHVPGSVFQPRGEPCVSVEAPLWLSGLSQGTRTARVTEGHPLSSRPPTEVLVASSQYLLGSI